MTPGNQIRREILRRAILTLNDRTYHCDQCGLMIDRDLNAAINLERVAYRIGGGLKTTGGDGSTGLPAREGETAVREAGIKPGTTP